jgi:hypothetical protein
MAKQQAKFVSLELKVSKLFYAFQKSNAASGTTRRLRFGAWSSRSRVGHHRSRAQLTVIGSFIKLNVHTFCAFLLTVRIAREENPAIKKGLQISLQAPD